MEELHRPTRTTPFGWLALLLAILRRGRGRAMREHPYEKLGLHA